MSNDSRVKSPASDAPWDALVKADHSPLIRPLVLAVALSANALHGMPRHILAPDAAVGQITLAELSADALTGNAAPDLILSPMVSCGFDAMDLLSLLREAGYRGRYLVLAPAMPDIELVRAEIMAQSGEVNVDIIALDGTTALHLV